MASNIGAGSRTYMGTGAVPVLPFTTSATLTTQNRTDFDVSDNLNSMNVSTTQGTVDITKLTADKDAFFRRFIAGLLTATGSGNYGELDTAGTFIRRVFAARAGVLHPNGRGKVDFITRPHGDGAGKIQYRGTILITDAGLNVAVEDEVGGDFSVQYDGQIVLELQV